MKSVRQGGNKIGSCLAGRFSVVATIPADWAVYLQTRCATTVAGLHLFSLQKERLFTDYGLTMNFEQYVLVGSTVRSYLAWLKDTGRVNALFENNMLLWQRI